MRDVTNLMINEFGIKELGYDWMGYSPRKGDIYTFHHLIIPRRDCKKKNIPNEGYIRDNGAILCGSSSHPYLHLIERYKLDYFNYITSEMIDMNVRGEILKGNLHEIDMVLKQFESEYECQRSKKGNVLVKSLYKDRHHF